MEMALTNAQMRASDLHTIQNLGICAGQLMKNAGAAIADEAEIAAKNLNANDILVVCGTGNNGGDGYICAQKLADRGFDVKIYAFDDTLADECARAKQACKCAYSDDISGSIIIDCIFGTGFNRKAEGRYAEVIQKINASGAYVISADIPSGLNGDNGIAEGCAVKANLTVAIAEYKAGMLLNDGIDHCGKIVKKNIGIVCPKDEYILIYGAEDIKKYFPKRPRNSHKGTYGSACIVAGSDKYIGAAVLSLSAALKSGCGYVKLATTERVALSLAPRYPSAIYPDCPDLSAQSIAIGMGCGISEQLYNTIKALLKEYCGTLLIDADGLNALARYGIDILFAERNCRVILTPHVKEFSRLTGRAVGEIVRDPVNSAKQFAKQYNVTVLLKGAASVITDGARVALNVNGNTALSKGGSGDMLSGYLCGTLARGVPPFEACVCAAYVLGHAAEIAAEDKTEYCATARDIIKNLHFSVKRLT